MNNNGAEHPNKQHENQEKALKMFCAEVTNEMKAFDPIDCILPESGKAKLKKPGFPRQGVKRIMQLEVIVQQELQRDRTRAEHNPGEEEECDWSSITEPPRRIGEEALLVMSQACELFVRELTWRAWRHTEGRAKKTLRRQDIAAAVKESETFDFLIDIIPPRETNVISVQGQNKKQEHL